MELDTASGLIGRMLLSELLRPGAPHTESSGYKAMMIEGRLPSPDTVVESLGRIGLESGSVSMQRIALRAAVRVGQFPANAALALLDFERDGGAVDAELIALLKGGSADRPRSEIGSAHPLVALQWSLVTGRAGWDGLSKPSRSMLERAAEDLGWPYAHTASIVDSVVARQAEYALPVTSVPTRVRRGLRKWMLARAITVDSALARRGFRRLRKWLAAIGQRLLRP
jgi:hypothetical protein